MLHRNFHGSRFFKVHSVLYLHLVHDGYIRNFIIMVVDKKKELTAAFDPEVDQQKNPGLGQGFDLSTQNHLL